MYMRSPSPMRSSYSGTRSSGSGGSDDFSPTASTSHGHSRRLPSPAPGGRPSGSATDPSSYSLGGPSRAPSGSGVAMRGRGGLAPTVGSSERSYAGSSTASQYARSPSTDGPMMRARATSFSRQPSEAARSVLPPISSFTQSGATSRTGLGSSYVPQESMGPPTGMSRFPTQSTSAMSTSGFTRDRRSSFGSRPSAMDLGGNSPYPSHADLRQARSMAPGALAGPGGGGRIGSGMVGASPSYASLRNQQGGTPPSAPLSRAPSMSGSPSLASMSGREGSGGDLANPSSPFVCDVPGCGRVFTRSYNLTAHRATHSSDKKHRCDYCPQAFARRHDKERHERMHTGEKPYTCDACGKSFARSDALNRHRLLEPNCGRL